MIYSRHPPCTFIPKRVVLLVAISVLDLPGVPTSMYHIPSRIYCWHTVGHFVADAHRPECVKVIQRIEDTTELRHYCVMVRLDLPFLLRGNQEQSDVRTSMYKYSKCVLLLRQVSVDCTSSYNSSSAQLTHACTRSPRRSHQLWMCRQNCTDTTRTFLADNKKSPTLSAMCCDM